MLTVYRLEAVPDALRGALTRWCVEPDSGLYVGVLTQRVADELWRLIRSSAADGTCWRFRKTSGNEQKVEILVHNPKERIPVNFDGLTLIAHVSPRQEEYSPHTRG